MGTTMDVCTQLEARRRKVTQNLAIWDAYCVFGYDPSWTSLYVTGTATYRCVMKGSVHARAHGYKVQYVKNAVEGDGDDYDWKRYACPNFMNSGVKKSCHHVRRDL